MTVPSISSLICLLPLALHFQCVGSFSSPFFHRIATSTSSSTTTTSSTSNHPRQRPRRGQQQQPLYSGKGIATDYTWAEEAFEIEVTVKVPKDTRAKDIRFKATANSIDLRLMKEQDNEEEEVILLDPSRKLRGKVILDGTFWAFSDEETEASDTEREVTVTIEKKIKTAKDDFEVIEYDWKGVYMQDEEEVSFRKYDEPEPLDVREYAASLGVDIDNINMSMVDKDMFTSGLNLTKSSLDGLRDAGLVKEVTQQGDGTEWTTDDDGFRVPFKSMPDGNISPEEAQARAAATPAPAAPEAPAAKIPFIDTDSPWHKTVPMDKDEAAAVKDALDAVVDKEKDSEAAKKRKKKKEQLAQERKKAASDPIETLTVARLKEVLRARGLKVTGNKKELQERLKAEVQSMLTGSESENETNAAN